MRLNGLIASGVLLIAAAGPLAGCATGSEHSVPAGDAQPDVLETSRSTRAPNEGATEARVAGASDQSSRQAVEPPEDPTVSSSESAARQSPSPPSTAPESEPGNEEDGQALDTAPPAWWRDRRTDDGRALLAVTGEGDTLRASRERAVRVGRERATEELGVSLEEIRVERAAVRSDGQGGFTTYLLVGATADAAQRADASPPADDG